MIFQYISLNFILSILAQLSIPPWIYGRSDKDEHNYCSDKKAVNSQNSCSSSGETTKVHQWQQLQPEMIPGSISEENLNKLIEQIVKTSYKVVKLLTLYVKVFLLRVNSNQITLVGRSLELNFMKIVWLRRLWSNFSYPAARRLWGVKTFTALFTFLLPVNYLRPHAPAITININVMPDFKGLNSWYWKDLFSFLIFKFELWI